MAKILPLLFVVFFFSFPAHSNAASPTPIEALYSRLTDLGAVTKGDLLAALPEELKRNFVLVSNSRSRQKGTPELPRLMHFSKSGDLIVTASGHPQAEDFAANDLEAMELDHRTGIWRMAMIHFDGKKLAAPVFNHRSCLACHGENPRPIWGEFGHWPDAFGGDPENGLEKMGPEERVDFLKFAELAKSHEAYRHLKFEITPDSYALLGTTFARPNTTFTARIGSRQAEAVFLRMKASPNFPRLRYALLAANPRLCAPNAEFEEKIESIYAARIANDPAFAGRWKGNAPRLSITKVIRLLDLDPYADFRLDRLPRLFDPTNREEYAIGWNEGSDSLLSLASTHVLEDLWSTDEGVRKQFDSRVEDLSRLHLLLLASNDALSALDQASSATSYLESIFPKVEENAFGLQEKQLLPVSTCSYLSLPR